MGTRHRSAPDRDTGSRSHAVALVVVGGTAEGGCLSSGSTLVLVDDTAEDVATDDLAVSGGRECGAGERWVEIETAVGPGFVVMADVLGEQGLQMSL